MPESGSKTSKRPTIITIFCIIFFVSIGLSLLRFPDMIKKLSEAYGVWFAPYWIVTSALAIVSFIGYRNMRRWGVYLYTALFVIGIIVNFAFLGSLFTMLTLMPIIIIIIGFVYLKRMH